MMVTSRPTFDLHVYFITREFNISQNEKRADQNRPWDPI